MRILALDPSGNWSEGKGITGWALFKRGELFKFGDVRAKEYSKAEHYWAEVCGLVDRFDPHVVVYETYALQSGKAMEQSWSQMETPQLIGLLRWWCWVRCVPAVGQPPSIKARFSDSVLERLGIIERTPSGYKCMEGRTNDHIRDAIRHGMYYNQYSAQGVKARVDRRA